MSDHAHSLTLIEFIRQLLGYDSESIQLRDWFQKDPQAALDHYGLGHLTAEDVHDAMVLVQDNDTVSFDREYDTGVGGIDWTWGKGGFTPVPNHSGGPEHGSDHGSGHDSGHDTEVWREHVTNNHVTNNIDDRDTIIDRSVNQNVDTHGGDFEQSIDDHSVNATGDGSVAAGGDISGSTVTTGSGNVVGDGNKIVSGDGNTTAFGSGSAVKGVSVDDGSAFSVNGDASGNSSTNGSFNTTHAEDNDHTSIRDSYNEESDNSVHSHTDDHSHTDVGSHNAVDLHLG